MTLRQFWCMLRGHAGVKIIGYHTLECKRCGHSWTE